MKIKLFFLIVLVAIQVPLFAEIGGLNFSADVSSGNGHLTVTFTNKSVGTFDSYTWGTLAGNAKYTTKQDFVVTYTRPGYFDVSLSARGADGKYYNLRKTSYISISPTQLPPYELTSNDITIDSNGFITACNINNFNTLAHQEGNLKIPSIINGQTIKGIIDTETGIFNNKGITKLALPNTLEYVGKLAFVGNDIQSLSIPNGVVTIEYGAFASNDLHDLKIPPSVERIENSAFRHQVGFCFGTDDTSPSNTQITFVDTVGNPDIKQSRLKYIGPIAFYQSRVSGGNSGIIEGKTVTGMFIPPSVEEIDAFAFGTHNIQNLAFTDGDPTCPKSKLRILRQQAFYGNELGSVKTAVVIPASIEIIEEKALYRTVYPYGGGKVVFEDNSSLYSVGEWAYGGSWDNFDPAIRFATLPTQKAANNTRGLWTNTVTGKLITAESDSTYRLKDNSYIIYKAAYVVNFVDEDGAVLKKDTVMYGNSATAPIYPAQTGYIFTGWDKDYSKITQRTTLTALYAPIVIRTVTFIDWDDSIIKEEKVNDGDSVIFPDSPIHNNYSFQGWYNADGKQVTSLTNIKNDTTIKAQYTPITNINTTISNTIKIYPNPSKDWVTVENNHETKIQSIIIYNVKGTVVYVNNNPKIKQSINISEFTKGVYIVEIGSFKSKLIVL